METDRIILHCDLNNFYATAACRQNPHLKGLPLAVCGNPAHRHGIVLAKSEETKKYGIKTGDALWQAPQKCSGLVTVAPDFPQYTELSKEIREIYRAFTDQVEPFGIDECWLDVTGSSHLFDSGRDDSPVLSLETMAEAKSVGHGITCTRDLCNEREAMQILHFLAHRVTRRLREGGFWPGPSL